MENKIMENEEIVVATEEIATSKTGKVAKVAIGVGLAALVGRVIYKRVIKPRIAMAKAKKAQRAAEETVASEETEPKMIFDDKGNPIE